EDAGGSYPSLNVGWDSGADGLINPNGTVNLNGGFLYSKGFPSVNANGTALSAIINFNGGMLGTRHDAGFNTEQHIRDAITAGDWDNGVSLDPDDPSWLIRQVPAGFTKYKHNGTPQSIWGTSSPPRACDMYVGPADTQDLGNIAQGDPGSVDYSVFNGGSDSVSYTVAESPDETWLTLTKTAGGPLDPGSTDPVPVTANIDTSTLGAGTYTANLVFTPDCTTSTIFTRSITFEVVDCYFQLLPEPTDGQIETNLTVYSHCIAPMDYSLELKNSGSSAASYTVASNQAWLTLDPGSTSGGPLEPGSSDTINFTVTGNAKPTNNNVRDSATITVTTDYGQQFTGTVARDDTYIGDMFGETWTYAGDVMPADPTDPTSNTIPHPYSSCGDGCRFTVKSGGASAGAVFGTIIDDPEAWNGKAFHFDQWGTGIGDNPDPQGSLLYHTEIYNPATLGDQDYLQGRLGATMVCRTRVDKSTQPAWTMAISNDGGGDPQAYCRARVLWGGPGGSHRRDIVEYIQDPDLKADNVVGTGAVERAYHIIRIGCGWGAYGSDGSNPDSYHLYTIKIWFNEDPTPILDIPDSDNGGNYNYDAFLFGAKNGSSKSIMTYDWVTFTDAGIFAPGEDTVCFGADNDLIPEFVQCNIPFADADGDGDVDQNDFAQFQRCYTGLGGGLANNPNYDCACVDWDNDLDVDDNDFSEFQKCASGPNIPVAGDPDCDFSPQY
ncbi:MAG: COG1470 family protein, partial [Planctomycetota bacterium]